MRTQLTLDIAGLLPLYQTAFDTTIYQKNRDRFFGEVLISDDPFLIEIRNFAKKRSYSIPWKSCGFIFTTKLKKTFSKATKFTRKIKRRINNISVISKRKFEQ